MNKKPFLIYKSSAGSGKTYTLAKNYIRLALKTPFNFKKILAVTFTNKASNEMKERILEMIQDISIMKQKDLINEYAKYYKVSSKEIIERAKDLQKNLIHNYSYFAVTTIDTFFYGIIQSFTRDLKFRGAFNIEMDQELVTNEVVNNFLSGLKKGSDLSKWLTEFSKEKLTQEKDFMISQELRNMVKNLFSEEFKSLSKSLENKSYTKEIKALKSKIYFIKKDFENKVILKSKKIYDCLISKGYKVDDFSYKDGGIAGFLRKTSEGIIVYPGIRVSDCIHNPDKWVSKTQNKRDEILSFIKEKKLADSIADLTNVFDNEFTKYNTALEIKNYLYVFGILSEVQKKVIEYREENDVILISDISELLYEIIKDDNIPFVFEKVGNTFKNFLIDEFQDTSHYQWKNFKPLIIESLATGDQNIIVGDLKQSIYRWRGSDSSIMNSVVKSDIDNSVSETVNLNTNWRSGEEIIEFNNFIFTKIPSLFEDDSIKNRLGKIYNKEINQEVTKDMSKKGYVEVVFRKEDDEVLESAKDFTIDCIKRIQDKGYEAGDIGIIVRDNNDARKIAEILIKESKTDDKYNYNHVSSDALNIKSAPIVSFFISVLTYLLNYKDRLALSEIVHFYHRFVLVSDNFSHYAMSNDEKLNCLPLEFKNSLFEISRLPFYEMIEEIIRIFHLSKIKDQTPYLQAFQDLVLEFKRSQKGDANSFLDWWKKNSNKKLKLTDQDDAIRLITIHKAKGLEFDHVIIPFFDWTLDNDTRGNKEKIIWVDLERFDSQFKFPYPIKYRSKHPNNLYLDYYEEERNKAFEDNVNLMYVSFTRPRIGLFVNAREKGKEIKTVSDLLYESLKSKIISNKFITGNFSSLKDFSTKKKVYNLTNYPSFSWKDRIRIRSSSEEGIDFDSVSRGKILHEILLYIKSYNDINKGIEIATSKNIILSSEKEYYLNIVNNIINNQKIKKFFNPTLVSYNELEVLNENGNVFRIDRLVELNDKSLCLIDYKTGKGNEMEKDVAQVENYKNILRRIDNKNVGAYLIYIDLNKIVKV